MNANKIIKMILVENGISSENIGKEIGIGGSVFRRRMQNNNPRVNTVLDALDVLGYELTIQKKKRGRHADGQFVVTKEARG